MENRINFTTVDLTNFVEYDDVITAVERYTIPFICIFGLIGNAITAFVFSRRPLRDNSSSFFIVAKSFSDNGFLSTLFITWTLSLCNLRTGGIPGLCHMLIFFTYFFGCVSVWLVVLLTSENYIRICKPFLVSQVCKTAYAKASVIVQLVLTVSIYNFPFWTMGEQCVPYRIYYGFIHVMTFIDLVLTFIIPVAIMAVLLSAVVMKTIASYRRHRRMCTSSMTTVRNPLTKVTTTLLAVTLTFFILSLPYHAVRLKLMIMEKQSHATKLTFGFNLQSVSQMIYYLSMAINVVIYTIFSSKFRTAVKDIYSGTTTYRYALRVIFNPERNLSLSELPGNRMNGNGPKIEETFPLRRFQSSDT